MPSVWHTRHEILCLCREVRFEALPFFNSLHLKVEDPYCCIPPNFAPSPYQWKLSLFLRTAVSRITTSNDPILSRSIGRAYFPHLQTVLVDLEHDDNHDLARIMGPGWLATDRNEWEEKLQGLRQGLHDDVIVDAVKRSLHTGINKRINELLESQIRVYMNLKMEIYNARLGKQDVSMVCYNKLREYSAYLDMYSK